MIDLIIRLFFTKSSRDKKSGITVLKNREIRREIYIEERKANAETKKTDDRTCLSKYFENIKGLNVQERLGIFNRFGQR